MHPNAALINTFYSSFQKLNAEGMAACYAPDVVFSDPAFPELHGQEAGDMWRMLCKKAKDFSLVCDGVEADDKSGKAHWVATYTFSASGRKVVNDIHASFTIRDGKIIRHIDQFDLWKWSRQALGLTGVLLGWTPAVQGKIKKQAAAGLAAYRKTL